VGRGELRLLKWLTALVPAAVVLIYESAREEALEHVLPGLPVPFANVVVWVLVLLLTAGFTLFVFRVLDRLQVQALLRSRDVAALNAVLEERSRLSRELHDGLAQLAAFLLVRLDTVTDLVAANRRSEALAELERMRGVTDDLYKDVRESISDLRTGVAERGLATALRDYVDEYEERHDIQVTLHGEELAEGLRPLSALQLLRIVQEALANVRKHSGASRASISFTGMPGGVQVVIADVGRGFEPARSSESGRPNFGLVSMRERTESIGGTFVVDSAPGGGTRVLVSVPFENATEDDRRGSLATTAG